MKHQNVVVYYGEGRGKTNAALGKAVMAASQGHSVYIIQFFKRANELSPEFFSRLEPEVKLFRFQRSAENYDELTAEEQQEENMNMKNGINFARKVLATEGCEVLVLDEFLGLVDNGVIKREELEDFFSAKPDQMELILTGRHLDDAIRDQASDVYNIGIN